MKIYRLHTKQNLPITLRRSLGITYRIQKTLQKITPEYMGFQNFVRSRSTDVSRANYPIYSDASIRHSCEMGHRNNARG
jgi:hypothetical protein